jgi:hypothetical protein
MVAATYIYGLWQQPIGMYIGSSCQIETYNVYSVAQIIPLWFQMWKDTKKERISSILEVWTNWVTKTYVFKRDKCKPSPEAWIIRKC